MLKVKDTTGLHNSRRWQSIDTEMKRKLVINSLHAYAFSSKKVHINVIFVVLLFLNISIIYFCSKCNLWRVGNTGRIFSSIFFLPITFRTKKYCELEEKNDKSPGFYERNFIWEITAKQSMVFKYLTKIEEKRRKRTVFCEKKGSPEIVHYRSVALCASKIMLKIVMGRLH